MKKYGKHESGGLTRIARTLQKLEVKRQKAELKREERMQSSSLLWVWEFSKKVVLICFLIYVAEQVYAAVAMWRFADFTYLGTMLEQSSDILRTCVFGYFIKAGVENACKIWSGKAPGDAGTPNGEPKTDDAPMG